MRGLSDRGRILFLLAIMAVVAVITAAMSLWLLYQTALDAPLPELHHGLDKVKFPISTIGPQHGCLLWYLVAVQRSL